MSAKIQISKEELQSAINKGFNTEKNLVEYFNVSLSTIRRRLRESNIKLFKRCFDENRFFILYKEGKNDSEIAKILNCNHQTIADFRIKNQLPSNFDYKYYKIQKLVINKSKQGLSIDQIASDLKIDSRLISMYLNTPIVKQDYTPSEEEKQIILGSLLGDGCISPNKYNTQHYFVFGHSEAQKEYCIWKTIKLQKLMYYWQSFNKVKETDKRNNKVYYAYRSLSKELNIFTYYFNRWYSKENNRNIKHVCREDLFQLDALGLAIWFQDDGFRDKSSGYCISTQCFSSEDLSLFKEYFLEKWKIEINIRKDKTIYIPTKYKNLFTKIIKPYICDCCKYKLIE